MKTCPCSININLSLTNIYIRLNKLQGFLVVARAPSNSPNWPALSLSLRTRSTRIPLSAHSIISRGFYSQILGRHSSPYQIHSSSGLWRSGVRRQQPSMRNRVAQNYISCLDLWSLIPIVVKHGSGRSCSSEYIQPSSFEFSLLPPSL